MDNNARPPRPQAGPGFLLAPIHATAENTPLRVCVLLRQEPDPAGGPFVLLRELPGSRVYLGAVADAAGRVQQWIEVWVQTVELRDLAFSSHTEHVSNPLFDQRWRAEHELAAAGLPAEIIVTGMETNNPTPILMQRRPTQPGAPFAPAEPAPWQICKDDALLDSFGLPLYSMSAFRYLHQPTAGEAKTFLATDPDAPANAHVQGLDRLKADSATTEIFNPHAGLVRVASFSPLGLDDYLQILEGRPWSGTEAETMGTAQSGPYAELRSWSANPKGLPFLLHGEGAPAERLNEIFFLKLSALLGMFKGVRAYAKAQQLPLLNLSPASFRLELPEVGDQFPALWSAQCALVKPGQAHPLQIKSTEQKYFVRLGKTESSPYLPEGLGAHSFGMGSVRRRNVLSEIGGTVLEGTLVAEDYLGIDPHDLLWFKLPVSEERLEFYAHVYTVEAVGPREARFRTVPMRLPESVVATLKNTASFAKAPYEIWPLLSSPCDLHSLGIIAIRALLANSQSNLPVIVDDVLGLARYAGKDPPAEGTAASKLKVLLGKEPKLLDLVSPHALVERDWTPPQARALICQELWLDAVAWLLRLFPGASALSYCKNFGDVAPLALETVFDLPLQELEQLVWRLRSVLTPTTLANEEIAAVLREQLAGP